MFKGIPIPASFSLIRKGKVFLLLKDGYEDSLLQEGIEHVEAFLQRKHPLSRQLKGRTLHPCVPIKEGEWMVVRRYSHGGLFRTLTQDLYLFGSRSFREVALTEEIRSCGIPTIQPIGAIHRSVFPFFYRAHLLSLEVPSAKDLIHYLLEMGPHPLGETLSLKRKVTRSAGLLLRQFHGAGFFHRDLQLKNLLLAGDRLFLIDFDRSYRKTSLSLRERLKNLLRLDRSVAKWKRKGLSITKTDRWRFFLAYAGDDSKLRSAMRRAVKSSLIRSLLYSP
jgi:3-deoxy-D-manno-octulosonic acid kinase